MGVPPCLAVLLGGLFSALWVYLTRPADNASNAEIVTHIALDVLIVGLVVFAIRFFALQTRADRHVEFVSRNKANALSTFNLIVAGQDDPAVRAQVASVLAQAVFKSDDGIFSDASSDSVTIVERVVGATVARPPGLKPDARATLASRVEVRCEECGKTSEDGKRLALAPDR